LSGDGRIEVVDYDFRWPATFEQLKQRLQQALGTLALAIEHVGSTAVAGLAAKPIIDLDVVIAGRAELPQVVSRLAQLGYEHEGDLGVTDREAFRQPPGEVPHHPYVCIESSLALRKHLALRDYLRAHPARALEYGRLKRDIISRGVADRSDYSRAKTAFLLQALKDAGISDLDLTAIEKTNF
jgi:GrpB-like predicted nucleotidyltransferase (UPF0157 family)